MSLDYISFVLGIVVSSLVFVGIYFMSKQDNVVSSVEKDIQKIQDLTLQRLIVEKELQTAQEKIIASQNITGISSVR